jgi:hypothetical protein
VHTPHLLPTNEIETYEVTRHAGRVS